MRTLDLVLPVFLTIFLSDSTDANYCNCVQQIVSILLLNAIFMFWLSGDSQVMQREAATGSRGKEIATVATQRQQVAVRRAEKFR